MKRKAIFINGDFLLSSARNKRAQAIVIENGIIADIGTATQIKPLAKRGYKLFGILFWALKKKVFPL